MRLFLVGILLICFTTAAWGQAEGEVELIGFGGWYRPHCWVPMKLRLRPTVADAETYRIQVIQEDMDRDRVSYSRPFTLNGSRPGERREEHVWVYFRPQPKLGDDGDLTTSDLTSLVRVFLCKGEKQILQIKFSAGTGLKSLDRRTPSGPGARMVIGLTTSDSQPNLSAAYGGAYGMMEDIIYVPVTANDLPTNPLGFDCVDDLIWNHPDPGQVNPDVIGGIEEWIKSGGRMVVCQSIEWQKMRDGPLAGMLPVVPTGMSQEKNARTLRKIGGLPDLDLKRFPSDLPIGTDPWTFLQTRPPFYVCQSAARPGATVAEWTLSETSSPYIARWMYGQGLVTWVAQDLGNSALQSKDRDAMRLYGWGKIWDTVLGLQNKTSMNPEALTGDKAVPRLFLDKCKEGQVRYPQGGNHQSPDPSMSFSGATEIKGRVGMLVGLAILFFIGYGLAACLGSYFFLLTRKKTHQSWFAFALCAIVATGITGLFVRLVLHGPPEMAQVSFVRWSGAADSRVLSQVGLLVKQDARLKIELKDTAPGLVSTVSPLPPHPKHSSGGDGAEFLGYLEYDVPVPERSTGTPAAITVPFRRTLKKFQLDWTGTKITGIEGRGSLGKNGPRGVLKNLSGHDLYEVYLAYNTGDGNLDDTLIRIYQPDGKPTWANGNTLDLADLWANRKMLNSSTLVPMARCEYGLLNSGWMRAFDNSLLAVPSGGYMGNPERAFLLLSLFDRIQPPARVSNDQPNYVLHRWTGRRLDASAAIMTGNMVILAKGDGSSDAVSPLPVTLEVDGQKMPGTGAVYYQFVVPLERPSDIMPTTQPVEK